jgi:hypothetical protein
VAAGIDDCAAEEEEEEEGGPDRYCHECW